MAECTHLDQVTITELPEEVEGCEDCLREGTQWLHLRTRHFQDSGHPIIRSLESGEEWSWCNIDSLGMVLPEVKGQTRIPPSPLGW